MSDTAEMTSHCLRMCVYVGKIVSGHAPDEKPRGADLDRMNSRINDNHHDSETPHSRTEGEPVVPGYDPIPLAWL